MQDDTPPGGAPNGEQLRTHTAADVQKVKEHLRAAGAAAGEAVRGRAHTATDTVRARAHDAGGWARSQWNGIQGRVESRPGMAALWALGLGLAAGLVISTFARGRR